MNTLLLKLKTYGMEIWSKKGRLVLSLLVFISLFTISCYYLFEGINKRFILFTLLSFLTGAFLVIPRLKKWYWALPVVLVYLAVIPRKIFQRIELPVHDMSGMQEGAELANIFIILLIYAVCLLIFRRVRFALAGGGVALLVIFLINYYVHLFRGTSLTLTDLMATGTALTVMDNYQLTMNAELWYSILYFCFFIVLGLWCDIPGKGKKYHLTTLAVSLAYCLFFYGFWNVSDYLEKHELHGHYWNTSLNQKVNGFLLSFGINVQEMKMEKPEGYSEQVLVEIAEQTRESYKAPENISQQNPNIIIIMNEAWSDLRVLGDLETSEEFMPFVDSLRDNVIKGNTHVQILGGLTANSEFEALTGDSLAFFAPSVVPYSIYVDHDMHSLARVLGEQGYQTMAMHPSGPGAWNRDVVYKHFGFEEFIDIDKFETELSNVGNFISDECNFNEIIWQFENKEAGKPLFLFDVTIQNHADYYKQVEAKITVDKVGSVPADQVNYLTDANTYINLMKITDDAFEKLLDYFEEVEEPTIICMFGDHQPNLSEDFYNAIYENSGLTQEEKEARKYTTPYVIWANYDVEFPEYGDMSANYLGAAVLECAGVKLSDYYKCLLQLQKEYPVLSFRTIEELKEEDAIKQYQILEYNQLIEKDYRKEIFAIVE